MASLTEKCGTSATPPIGGEQDDLCMDDPQPTLGHQAAEVGGANVEDDNDQCLYVRTPWEDDVIADHRDIDDLKVASRRIARTLVVYSDL
jgi:hypothetical protein